MKRLSLIAALLLCAATLLGCGSATEVGNPTGEVPRTISGMIDEATLPDIAASASKTLSPDELTIYAEATDGTSEEAGVNSSGSFSIDVTVGKTYAFSVRAGLETVGDFSFEINDEGDRGPSLEISSEGEDVELGRCLYEGGVFVPENEPRRYRGIEGAGENWRWERLR